MALVEEPSVLRRLIRLLQEPFSRIKERWMNYFAHLAVDDGPSFPDVESQSLQDLTQEKKNSSLKFEQDGNAEGKEDEPKEDTVEEADLEDSQPPKEINLENTTGISAPNRPPAGHRKMMYKVTMTAMGATIGLGHLWRFPNMAFKMQTGDFILIYSALTLICGFPLYFMSLSRGQFASESALKVFGRVPLLQGIGLSMVLYAYIMAVYQTQMIGFGIHYLASSFQFDLPWTKCGVEDEGTFGLFCIEPYFHTTSGEISAYCRNGEQVADFNRLCTDEDPIFMYKFMEECCGLPTAGKNFSQFYDCEEQFHRNKCLTTVPSSVHFWNVTVVRPSTKKNLQSGFFGMTNLKMLLYSLAASFLVYVIILLGLKRTVYISTFVIPLLCAAYILLILATLRKTGSSYGLLKLIKLDAESFRNIDIWYAALEQCLYSLGLGTSLVISIGAISPSNNASHKTALAVTVSVLGFNLLTAALVFAVCGVAASEWSRPFAFDAGMGTSYVVYSYALAQLPLPWLFSCIFYTLLAVAGACSLSGLLFSVTQSVSDIFNLSTRDRHILKIIIVLTCFLLGIPINMRGGLVFMEALDTATAAFSGPIIIALDIIFFAYGFKYFCEDIRFMLGFNAMKCLLPASLASLITIATVLTLEFSVYRGPDWDIWAEVIGFGSLALILSPILFVFILRLLLPFRKDAVSAPHTGRISEEPKQPPEECKIEETKV